MPCVAVLCIVPPFRVRRVSARRFLRRRVRRVRRRRRIRFYPPPALLHLPRPPAQARFAVVAGSAAPCGPPPSLHSRHFPPHRPSSSPPPPVLFIILHSHAVYTSLSLFFVSLPPAPYPIPPPSPVDTRYACPFPPLLQRRATTNRLRERARHVGWQGAGLGSGEKAPRRPPSARLIACRRRRRPPLLMEPPASDGLGSHVFYAPPVLLLHPMTASASCGGRTLRQLCRQLRVPSLRPPLFCCYCRFWFSAWQQCVSDWTFRVLCATSTLLTLCTV